MIRPRRQRPAREPDPPVFAVPRPGPRSKKRQQGLRRRGKSEAARRREEALAEAKERAREYWGERCLVPGCHRRGTHLHHAYGRATHPQWRAQWWNLVPLCGGEGRHHRLADKPTHWLHWAAREVADEMRAHVEGRRPPVTREEAAAIMARHREAAEPPVSPMGRAD